jgi:hypothetical protein
VEEEAYGYLSRLFVRYAPQCEPLPTLLGVVTQIDNLLTGLRERAEAAEARIAQLEQAWRPIESAPKDAFVTVLGCREEEKDHGAGLIHQIASPLAETEPRPNCAYLLYENFYNGREWKERLEHVALSAEDARAWVQADFPQNYSRTSIGIKVFPEAK